MDPSQDIGSEGEFNGTESGWTTYIGSQIYNEDEESVDMDEYGNKFKKVHEEKINYEKNVEEKDSDDGESDDDSMASDASSGPNYLQLVCMNSEGSHHKLDYHENEKIISAKRATKQEKKKQCEGLVSKEEESLLVDSAASHA